MATETVRTDYANEKQDVSYIEHAHSHTDPSLELQKEMTLTGVDMNNTQAVKGDDSDGKVEWSVRSIFAAIFLAALYTGINHNSFFSVSSIDLGKVLKLSSISREALLVSSKRISVSLAALHGYPQPTFLRSLPPAHMQVIYRIFSASVTSPCLAQCVFVLDAFSSPLVTLLRRCLLAWPSPVLVQRKYPV